MTRLEQPDYPAYVEALARELPELASTFRPFTGIENVLEWMKARNPGRWEIDLVGQDEFSYDFLLEWESGGRWLAFGVT